MATKVCSICGKSNISGRRIQHHAKGGWRYKAPKTNRVFRTNMRKIDLEVGSEMVRAIVCMKCYKRLKKDSK